MSLETENSKNDLEIEMNATTKGIQIENDF